MCLVYVGQTLATIQAFTLAFFMQSAVVFSHVGSNSLTGFYVPVCKDCVESRWLLTSIKRGPRPKTMRLVVVSINQSLLFEAETLLNPCQLSGTVFENRGAPSTKKSYFSSSDSSLSAGRLSGLRYVFGETCSCFEV